MAEFGFESTTEGVLAGQDLSGKTGFVTGGTSGIGWETARGAGKSQGDIHAWGSVDGQDGYNVVEWVAQQPWSTGKVALHGTSWLAMAQWFIAQTKPPHLSAIAPWNGTTNIYRQNMMFGGILNVAFLAGVFAHLAGPARVERPDLMAQAHPLMDSYWLNKAARLFSGNPAESIN